MSTKALPQSEEIKMSTYFKFGSASNCYVNLINHHYDLEAVGGIEDGESVAVQEVSDDLDKLEQHIIAEHNLHSPELGAHADRNHYCVGGNVDDVGDTVVSVILDNSDDILAVIFTEPNFMPHIVA
jgi:hypothetical protein